MVYRVVYSTVHVIDQCTGICGGDGINKTSAREKYFPDCIFMPNLIGGIILGYIWQLLLNGVLAHWGKTLTYSGTYGLMGMIILVCWQQIGYMMIIYISGIQNIPGELIEAARLMEQLPAGTSQGHYSDGNAVDHDLYIFNVNKRVQVI